MSIETTLVAVKKRPQSSPKTSDTASSGTLHGRKVSDKVRNPRNIVNLLTRDLIQTYKGINERYYAAKRAARRPQPSIELARGQEYGRYRILDLLGRGAWSDVYLAEQRGESEQVAIKVNKVGEGYFRGLKKELSIYQNLNKPVDGKELATGVLDLKGFFYSKAKQKDGGELTFLNLVFPRCVSCLYNHVMSKPKHALPLNQVRFVGKTLLESMGSLHDRGLVHCDLKPENILVTRDGGLRVADFGISRWVKDCKPGRGVVQSFFYRAPEVQMGKKYDMSIDIWSLGCILYEMAMGKALFKSLGNDAGLSSLEAHKQMIVVHSRFLGVIEEDLIPADIKSSLPPHILAPELFHTEVPHLSDLGRIDALLRDLVLKMLTYDPTQRISCKEALSHNFFTSGGVVPLSIDSTTQSAAFAKDKDPKRLKRSSEAMRKSGPEEKPEKVSSVNTTGGKKARKAVNETRSKSV